MRRIVFWAGGALCVAGAAAACFAIVPGLLTDPPLGDLVAARVAIDSARAEGADRFAPLEMQAAESALRDAYRAYRIAEVSWLGWRDYDSVALRLGEALAKAEEAGSVADANRERQRIAALERLKDAESALATARRHAERVPVGAEVRSDMTRSDLMIAESRRYLGRGEYEAALERASLAVERLENVVRQIDAFLSDYASEERTRQWSGWISETIRDSRQNGKRAIIVDKLNRIARLYDGGHAVSTYRIDLGRRPLGQKLQAGDDATPEGRYRVIQKRGPGQTKYHKALLINYPNDEDRARFLAARRNGLVSHRASPGGLIEIHGEGGRDSDWTEGCVALSNADMDHLFDRVEVGTPVTIVGSTK